MSEETKVSVDAQKEKKPGKIKGFFSKIGKFIKRHKVLLVIIIIIIAAVIVFMVKKSQKQADSQVEAPVMTTELTKMDLQKSVSVTGTLTAGDTASVTSTLNGVKITDVNYEVGDYVEAGETVVVFDGDDYNTKLADLNAKYNISDKQSEHSIEEYQKQIEDYQKQITEDQEYLDTWADVYNNLKDAYDQYQANTSNEDAKTRWERESQAASTLDDGKGVSVSGYEAKQDEIEDLQDKIEEAQYNIELAQLQQEYDKNYTQTNEYDTVYDNMDNTKVTAPISGYITAMNVEEGNSYTMGSTIFTISDTSSFVVEATVDEYDVASISKGQKAVVKFDSTDDDEFSGEVTYIAIASGSSDSSSSTSTMTSSSSSSGYTLKIKLDSTDDRLRVGMTAKGSVILDSVEDVFAVPYDCIETDEDGNSYVTQVADDGTETKITVTVGLQSDYYEEIQSDELTEGMKLKATASSSDSSSSDDMMIMNMGGDMGGGDMGGGPGGGDMGGGF